MYWKFIITWELVDPPNVNLQHLHCKYYEEKKVHSDTGQSDFQKGTQACQGHRNKLLFIYFYVKYL